MGHTSLLDAFAAAFSPGPSRTLLPISSLVSAVLAGLFDVWELSDSELSEGDSKLGLRRCRAGGCGETAGDRFLPLPSTRPPPRDLREAIVEDVEGNRGCSWTGMGALGGSRGRRYVGLNLQGFELAHHANAFQFRGCTGAIKATAGL